MPKLPALDPQSLEEARGSLYPEPFKSRIGERAKRRLYVLEGEVVLVTNDGEQTLRAGMCAGYPAGKRDAHHFVNRSKSPARYLEIGTNVDGDMAFYPDDDLMWIETENGLVAAHKDGRRYA